MFRMPPFLKEGDTIALISPSYHLEDASFDKAVSTVESWGFRVIESPYARGTYLNCYSGTMQQRLSDLEWAFSTPDVKAVLASRGGYGTIQLLPYLSNTMFRDNQKWLIGYSDITSLHAFSVISGVVSVHGLMGSFLSNDKADAESITLTKSLLLGDISNYCWQSSVEGRCGRATGRLIGGNLATLVPLLGTAYDPFSKQMPYDDGIILFIEDVEESAHNIDRMLRIMSMHGVFDKVQGIVCGAFTDCGDEFEVGSVENLLSSTCFDTQDYNNPLSLVRNIPLAYNFPAGHGGENYPLIIGAKYELVVEEYECSLNYMEL